VIAPPAPQAVAVQPIYLHVPPEHAHDWARHCHKYHACDRPVYFVKSEEYAREHHANQNFDRGRHEGDYREHERREREYLEHEYRERHGERD
jgi:hypothetical protein